jgi:hypothetical protein
MVEKVCTFIIILRSFYRFCLHDKNSSNMHEAQSFLIDMSIIFVDGIRSQKYLVKCLDDLFPFKCNDVFAYRAKQCLDEYN